MANKTYFKIVTKRLLIKVDFPVEFFIAFPTVAPENALQCKVDIEWVFSPQTLTRK
jgi:hypothetical protein